LSIRLLFASPNDKGKSLGLIFFYFFITFWVLVKQCFISFVIALECTIRF